jgi:hypothetical protein
LVRDVRVEKTTPIDWKFNGSKAEQAAELNVEYVEEKTGPSTLRECRPELKLQDVYQPQSWPSRSHTISDPAQAKYSDIFVVRRDQYAKEGSLRMVCERRITGWVQFSLPEVIGINKTLRSTYYVCSGEYREACGGNAAWIPCGGNPIAWAKGAHPNECVKAEFKKISDVGGNRCGYATFEVTCSSN